MIVDLEDAVADADKLAARERLVNTTFDRAVHVHINAPETPFHHDDLSAMAALDSLAGVVVPMVESPDDGVEPQLRRARTPTVDSRRRRLRAGLPPPIDGP